MAVIDAIPGITVYIKINGVSVTEYNDPDSAEKVTKFEFPHAHKSFKYIESVDDTEFTVCVRVRNTYAWGHKGHLLCFRTFADGQWIESPLIRAAHTVAAGHSEREIKGHCETSPESGDWVIRKPKFQNMSIVDDNSRERNLADLENTSTLGSIEIRVYRVLEEGSDRTYTRVPHTEKSREVAEKALKGRAVSHGTFFSPAEYAPRPKIYRVTNLEEDRGPIAVFQFQYRSKDGLRSELILPRTPTPAAVPRFESLTQEERDRLARQQFERLHGRTRVKPEPTQVKQERTPAIKRESGQVIDLNDNDAPKRPLKVSRLKSGHAIVDLTDA